MRAFTRMLVLLAGCLGLSACSEGDPGISKEPGGGDTITGTNPETAGGDESGTRLRARMIVGADGSKELIGWYDKQREEECAFKSADEGKLRCVPTAHPVFDFADPECTKPLVTLPPQLDCNGNPPKYVMAMDYTQACIPSARLFEIGAASQTMVDPVYRSQQGGCQPVGNPMAIFYEVGAEVPMSELVEGTPVTE